MIPGPGPRLGRPGDQRHVLAGGRGGFAREHRSCSTLASSGQTWAGDWDLAWARSLGLVIIFLRHRVPESPRWLLTHGHPEEAERVVKAIEGEIERERGPGSLSTVTKTIKIRPRAGVGFVELAGVMLKTYPRRTVLGVSLIVSQAFLYNGVFFTFPLVLRNFYGVSADRTAFYILPFALSNFLGPVLLGRFFDTIGRRPMIVATYTISAILLAVSGYLFQAEMLSPATQTILWAARLLLRLLRRELGLSDRQRDLPGRAARHGHRPVLRRRHADRRHGGPGAIRPAHRYRFAHQCFLWEPVGLGPPVANSGRGGVLRRKGRTASLEEIASPLSAVNDEDVTEGD